AGARLHELLDEEDEPLERAARDDDARRLDAVPRRDPLTQRRVAAARTVGEDGLPVALDRRARAVRELGDGKAFGRGDAAREGDQTHALSLAGAARGRARLLQALGDELSDLGRRRADLDAPRLERFLLRLRRAGGAGD